MRPLLASAPTTDYEVNNEMDLVALRAEARRRINVRLELMDYSSLPKSVFEDEGLLIKTKTKKRLLEKTGLPL